LLRIAAGERNRAAAEALHGEGEVGEAVASRQDLAGKAQGANLERSAAAWVDRGMAQPAAGPEVGQQRAAGGGDVDVVDHTEGFVGPVLQVPGEAPVIVAEERPVAITRVGHVQSPWNTGFPLATKAS